MLHRASTLMPPRLMHCMLVAGLGVAEDMGHHTTRYPGTVTFATPPLACAPHSLQQNGAHPGFAVAGFNARVQLVRPRCRSVLWRQWAIGAGGDGVGKGPVVELHRWAPKGSVGKSVDGSGDSKLSSGAIDVHSAHHTVGHVQGSGDARCTDPTTSVPRDAAVVSPRKRRSRFLFFHDCIQTSMRVLLFLESWYPFSISHYERCRLPMGDF